MLVRNPAYYLLSKQHQTLFRKSKQRIAKKSGQPGRHYFLIPIHQQSPALREWTCTHVHTSVYDTFSDTVNKCSAYHLTIYYKPLAGEKIIVHAFFNFQGTYINCDARQKDRAIVLSVAEQEIIRSFAEEVTSGQFEIILENLSILIEEAERKKTEAITALEEESKKGTSSREYIDLLKNAISIFEDNLFLKIAIREERAIIRLLKQSFEYLNNKQKEKEKEKEKEEKEQQAPVMITDDYLLSLDAEFKELNAPFKEKAKKLSIENIEDILSLFKELNEKEKLRSIQLIEACKIGDEKQVAELLSPNDYKIIPKLLSLCIYHKQHAIFDFIYKKRKKIRNLIITDPLDFMGEAYYSGFLSIAYFVKDLAFFKVLIEEYHFSPNEMSLAGSLIYHIVSSDRSEDRGMPYVLALLKAGADIDVHMKMLKMIPISCDDRLAAMQTIKSKAKEIKEVQEIREKRSLLYVAADVQHRAAVEVLLDHYSPDYKVQKDDEDPFIAAISPLKKPLDREIIQLFIDKHHKKIDQRYADIGQNKLTALYYAAEQGKLETVKILLALKANPCALHEYRYVNFLKKSRKNITVTPLWVAAIEGFEEIVLEILKNPLPSQEIERVLLSEKFGYIRRLSDNIKNSLLEAHVQQLLTEAMEHYTENDFTKVLKLSKKGLLYRSDPCVKMHILVILQFQLLQISSLLSLKSITELKELFASLNTKELLDSVAENYPTGTKEICEKLIDECHQAIGEHELKASPTIARK